MPKWVKMARSTGQFWDSGLQWGIVGSEIKALPDPLPLDSLTAERIRLGGIIECDPPEGETTATAAKIVQGQDDTPAPTKQAEATAMPVTEAAAPEHVIMAAKQLKRKARPKATSPQISRKRKVAASGD